MATPVIFLSRMVFLNPACAHSLTEDNLYLIVAQARQLLRILTVTRFYISSLFTVSRPRYPFRWACRTKCAGKSLVNELLSFNQDVIETQWRTQCHVPLTNAGDCVAPGIDDVTHRNGAGRPTDVLRGPSDHALCALIGHSYRGRSPTKVRRVAQRFPRWNCKLDTANHTETPLNRLDEIGLLAPV